MAINSVSSDVQSTPVVQPQNKPAHTKEVENNKSKDDTASKAQSAPRPTVNTSGQVVGSHVNTQA